MKSPTKFETMVTEAFKNKSLPATIEIQKGKVVGIRYTHNIVFVRDEVEYIITSVNPESLFKQVERDNEIYYEEIPLNTVLTNIQHELNDILVIDTALEKLRMHFGDILKKPDVSPITNNTLKKVA